MTVFSAQKPVHGVTPLYFLEMQSFARNNFVDILRKTPAEISIPFIDSIIEIQQLIQDIYFDENWSKYPAEAQELLWDEGVMQFLVPKNDRHLQLTCEALTALKESVSLEFAVNDTDDSLIIGRVPFNALIKSPFDSIDRILDSSVNDVSNFRDKNGEFKNIELNLKLNENLLDTLTVAIGLLEDRINHIFNSTNKTGKGVITSKFESTIASIEAIDNALECVNGGYRDQEAYVKMNLTLSKLNKLGFNIDHPLAEIARRQTSGVVNLTTRSYNQQIIPKLENIKRIFDRSKTKVITNIDMLKGNNISCWYF